MSFYRVRIDKIKEDTVVTSYTRWLEAVIVKGTENQEVYVTFSPLFERIWLESKKRLPEYVSESRPISDSGANIRFAFTTGRKSTSRPESVAIERSKHRRVVALDFAIKTQAKPKGAIRGALT